MNTRDFGLAVAAGALLLDQVSKMLLLFGFGFINMAPGEAIDILPFFNLVMAWNSGVSYGLFPASSAIGVAVLVVAQLSLAAGMAWWMWRTHRLSLAVGQGLIVGGALGNIIDRLIYGKVADFFHFYAFGYDWYVFNVADIAITFGAMVLIYDVMKPEPHAKDA